MFATRKSEKMANTITLLSSVFLYCLFGVILGDCDSKNGPAGSPECVLLTPYYEEKQWASCLTQTYIRTITKDNGVCSNTSATYCYYQCMMESYLLDSGPVYEDCRCNCTQNTTLEAIPQWCYSPDGSDCSWYLNCLEKRYHCQESGDSYAVDFAKRFCDLYTQHYKEFSTIGQKWIDAVRRCLQVQLVPILRPCVSLTCTEIMTKALASHTGCFVNPNKGAPSVCDIDVNDWWQTFWTVKGNLLSKLSITTLVQMESVMIECTDNRPLLKELLLTAIPTLRFRFLSKDILEYSQNRTRFDETDEYNITKEVSGIISHTMNWKERGVSWFAYPTDQFSNNTINETSFIDITMIITSEKTYNLNANNATSSVNMTEVLKDVTRAVENGTLQVNIGHAVKMTQLSVCSDLECSKTSTDFIPKPVDDASVLSKSYFVIVLASAGVVSVLAILSVIAGLMCRRRK